MEKIRVGDKMVDVDHYDSNGMPVIKAECRQIKHEDGRIDVIVNVPCLQIASEKR